MYRTFTVELLHYCKLIPHWFRRDYNCMEIEKSGADELVELIEWKQQQTSARCQTT